MGLAAAASEDRRPACRLSRDDDFFFRVDGVQDQAGHHLGVEVGGFPGHGEAGGGHLLHLFDAGGVQDKGQAGFPLGHRGHDFADLAGIFAGFLVIQGLGVQPQDLFENQVIQDRHIQLGQGRVHLPGQRLLPHPGPHLQDARPCGRSPGE